MKKIMVLLMMYCFSFLIILLIGEISQAQDGILMNDSHPAPSNEKFENIEELLMPQRSIRCLNNDKEANFPNCVGITSPEIWISMDALSLYNKDGSLWNFFSLNVSDPNHFLKKTETNLLPFSTSADVGVVIFRLIRESENWYEIEINEKTKASKFIPKKDILWSKVSWVYFLTYLKILHFSEDNRPQLFDKPNGNLVSEVSAVKWNNLEFLLKIEGDWAYVKGHTSSKSYTGWVKWKQGRKMLFSSKLWNYKFNTI